MIQQKNKKSKCIIQLWYKEGDDKKRWFKEKNKKVSVRVFNSSCVKKMIKIKL